MTKIITIFNHCTEKVKYLVYSMPCLQVKINFLKKFKCVCGKNIYFVK